jgi:hypothetical protein
MSSPVLYTFPHVPPPSTTRYSSRVTPREATLAAAVYPSTPLKLTLLRASGLSNWYADNAVWQRNFNSSIKGPNWRTTIPRMISW